MSARIRTARSCGSKHSATIRNLENGIDAPDYIPTITNNVVAQTNALPADENVPEKPVWGRLKNISQIRSEINWDLDSEHELQTEKRQTVGIEDFQRTAQLFIKSKKLVQRARSRYGSKALKLLQRKSTRSNFGSDNEGLSTYNLLEMHTKIKRQRQIKLAFLQQQFLDELPKLREKTVREHLERKIKILETIKTSDYVSKNKRLDFELNEEHGRPASDLPTKRQSRLRKSIDMTNAPRGGMTNAMASNINLTLNDIERELAVARSREQIEGDLALPVCRMSRFATLKQNIDKINLKFKILNQEKKGAIDKLDKSKIDEEKPFYAPSRFKRNGMAKDFFRKHARIVVIVLQWISMIMDKQYDFEKELKSFIDIANEIDDHTISSTMQEFGLQFDKKFYKANKEISLSSEARKILTTRWQSRTPDMIKQVMMGLQSLRSLSEYPVQTQEKLCKVAWYQTIGPKKPIVRQGHHAESFYFILSGTAFVKKMVQDPVTGETAGQVAARLTKGHSFGEIGLLFDTLRTATVESATAMELLVIGKEDFVRIFMKAEDPDDDADHIKFLKAISFMEGWPMDILKAEPGACLTHYFKRGSLITDNDRHSEWIYIIMSGTCEVLKKLKAVKPRNERNMRPKSDPLADIILPELGMPNNHAKIDCRKQRSRKVTIHPEVFQDMTDFYDSLRQKYKPASTAVPKAPETSQTPEQTVNFIMPSQSDKQLPKIFIRSASARRTSDADGRTSKVRFMEIKEKTMGDLPRLDIKMEPLVHENKSRPCSRSTFDESMPKIQAEHFPRKPSFRKGFAKISMLPCPKKLSSHFRPGSRDIDNANSACKVVQPADDVFVKVEALQSKNCFGLNTLKYVIDADDDVFDVGDEDVPILSLVSRGAEVIMLSKKVFLKFADQRCRLRVREQIKVYPSEEAMQDNMQKEADWSLYKENTMSKYVSMQKHKAESVHRCTSRLQSVYDKDRRATVI